MEGRVRVGTAFTAVSSCCFAHITHAELLGSISGAYVVIFSPAMYASRQSRIISDGSLDWLTD